MQANPVKKEEARRVWRLNKKEGVPVLEALETADISKDTYYEYKADYEAEWEGQITTAEEIENELERLRGEISDLSERAEEVGGEFSNIEEEFSDIEDQIAAEQTAGQLWKKMEKVEWRVEQIDIEEEETYPGKKRERLDLRKMREQLTETMKQQKEIVEVVNGKAEASRLDNLESKVEELKREVRECPRTLMEMVFPGNYEE